MIDKSYLYNKGSNFFISDLLGLLYLTHFFADAGLDSKLSEMTRQFLDKAGIEYLIYADWKSAGFIIISNMSVIDIHKIIPVDPKLDNLTITEYSKAKTYKVQFWSEDDNEEDGECSETYDLFFLPDGAYTSKDPIYIHKLEGWQRRGW